MVNGNCERKRMVKWYDELTWKEILKRSSKDIVINSERYLGGVESEVLNIFNAELNPICHLQYY
jgi:hypothetical protein